MRVIALRETWESLTNWWRQRRRKAALRPEVLRKWYHWESVSSSYFQVYYVPPKAKVHELQRIVQGCDEVLQQVTALLPCKPARRPITVFLYPDDHSFRRCERLQGRPLFSAIARGNSISLPYGTWQAIASSITHEATHVTVGRYCGKPAPLLLNEGMAMYVENRLYPYKDEPPTPRLDLPLCVLVNSEQLWRYLSNFEEYQNAYAHVHSLAWYLIDRYGMEAFLKVLKASAGRTERQREKRFVIAIQKTYGLTVDELEHKWRRDSARSAPCE